MTRVALFLAAVALGAAIWWTWDSTSLLFAFLATFAFLALSLGVAMVIGDVSRECPPMPESDDWERIESHEEFLRELGRAIDKGAA